jgi:tRNA threonylcarbamoyladenosine modification (KEOPS) complex Cgi121 subunit
MVITSIDEHRKILLVEGLISNGMVEYESLTGRLRKVAPRSTVQLMDGEKILGYDHVLFAVLNALNARQRGRTISGDIALEILVYTSAQRQIRRALSEIGLKPESRNIILVAVSDSVEELENIRREVGQIEGLRIDSSFIESWREDKLEVVKRTFEISDSELEAIRIADTSKRHVAEKLVIERMALLSVNV